MSKLSNEEFKITVIHVKSSQGKRKHCARIDYISIEIKNYKNQKEMLQKKKKH